MATNQAPLRLGNCQHVRGISAAGFALVPDGPEADPDSVVVGFRHDIDLSAFVPSRLVDKTG